MKQKDGFTGERSIVLPQMVVEAGKDDPLVSSLYITDIGYYPHAVNHYRERAEPIGQHVLIFCMEGAGWYKVDGRRYRVSANQYFILPAGKPHIYASDSDQPWTIYWVHFSGAHAPIYAEGALQPHDARPGQHSRIGDRNNIFEEIFSTLQNGYSRENLRYVSSILHYYLASMRYIMQFREAGNHADEANIVAAGTHYMKENLEKRLKLEDIASYTGYSPTHFSYMFKRQTGHSPLSYFNLLKVQQACLLLDSTEMKINQICYKVGIEDSYYFSRLFSKIMGMSPKQYKKIRKS